MDVGGATSLLMAQSSRRNCILFKKVEPENQLNNILSHKRIISTWKENNDNLIT